MDASTRSFIENVAEYVTEAAHNMTASETETLSSSQPDVPFALTTPRRCNSSATPRSHLPPLPTPSAAVIMYYISICTILSNIPVFYALPRLKGKIRAPTRYCMISLLITDSTLGIVLFITRTVYIADVKLYMDHICFYEAFGAAFLVDMTVVGLTVMNLDRVLVILKPMTYGPWMTSKKCQIIILFLWFAFIGRYTPIFILTPEEHKSYLEGAYVCNINYKTISSFTVSGIIFLLVLPFVDSIASLVAVATILTRRFRRDGRMQNNKSKESAMLIAVFALTTIYFFMTAPFCISVLIWQTFAGQTMSPMANFVTTWLLACNSVVNPFIYFVTIKSYRHEVLKGIAKLAGMRIQNPLNAEESRLSTHNDNETSQ